MHKFYGDIMLQVQKKVVKGAHGTRVKKVRTSVKFYRPKTFRPPRYRRENISFQNTGYDY